MTMMSELTELENALRIWREYLDDPRFPESVDAIYSVVFDITNRIETLKANEPTLDIDNES